jgi:hypothetical protein
MSALQALENKCQFPRAATRARAPSFFTTQNTSLALRSEPASEHHDEAQSARMCQAMKIEKLEAFLAAGGARSRRTEMRTAPAAQCRDDKHRSGMAAQHLAAFDILMKGHFCSVSAEQLPYDLIADINGLRRIQVKCRNFALYRGPTSLEAMYDFHGLAPEGNDLFAFVAMPERMVMYRLASTVHASSVTIPQREMTEEAALRSWKMAIKGWR